LPTGGLHAVSEERDAEEVRGTPTRYSRLRARIVRHGGSVEKFIGTQ